MKTATKLRLVSTGPKRSFIELTDSGRAIGCATALPPYGPSLASRLGQSRLPLSQGSKQHETVLQLDDRSTKAHDASAPDRSPASEPTRACSWQGASHVVQVLSVQGGCVTDAEHEAMLSGEIVTAVRQAANDVTGGNCAFADDDVAVLAHLAHRAVKAGLTDKLHPQIQRRIAKRAASVDRSPEGEKPQALSAQHESAVPRADEADAQP